MRALIVSCVLVIAAHGSAHAQSPRPSFIATRTDRPPTIDGRLDEPAWSKATVETHFIQNFPAEGSAPSEATELRVLYDDDAVYVAVRCFDRDPRAILARLTRRDRDVEGDKVTVDISSKNDNASAFHFQVSAASVEVDGLRFNDTDYNNDWDGRWYAATTRDDKGWTAELAIPLVTLRYAGEASSFGFQVRRYIGRNQEIDEWSYVPRTARGEVSYYGRLDGLRGVRPGRLVEIQPYVSPRLTVRRGQGMFDGNDFQANVGADLKVGVTSGLTLDATVNPDYGTVEVDQRVLNLTTVETYYPEKRPFFIEGADLFATPFKLFYTRRVGAAPPPPSLGSTATLDAPLPDGRIWGALKLTGFIGDRLSIAALTAVTARQDAAVVDAPGMAPREVLVDPLSSFSVLRLKQEFATSSSIGLLATAVKRDEPADAAAPLPGDLCPVPYSTEFTSLVAPPSRNGRCTNDAYTGGVDATLRTNDGEWGASGQLVGSVIEHGPTRLIADGTAIGSGDTGVGVMAEAGRYGGEHWLYRLRYTSASPRLQLNDAGYQDQANFQNVVASLMWRTTKPTKAFQSASVEAYFEHKRDWAMTDNLLFDPEIRPTVQFPNFWVLGVALCPYFPRWVENRETQDGARTQREGGLYYSVDLTTNPNKSIVGGLHGSVFKVYDGLTSLNGSLAVALRPITALELEIAANVGRASNNPRWIDTATQADGSRTYYFSRLDARSLDVTLRGTYTFTKRLTLQTYVQPFYAKGRYSDVTSSTASGTAPLLTLDSFAPAVAPGPLPDFKATSLNMNVFLRWEYRPFSMLWLVYTRTQESQPGPITDQFQIKLSYLY